MINFIRTAKPMIGIGCRAKLQSSQRSNESAMKQANDKPSGFDRNSVPILWRRIPTPLGPMIGAANNDALVLLEFADRRALEKQRRAVCRRFQGELIPGDNHVLKQAEQELSEYFSGSRTRFDVPLNVPGTVFQSKIWNELRAIAAGETKTYSELARNIDKPDAVRAVGRANSDNRIAIMIPCHRVIGADGKLTGYAGGLWRKRKLLDLEQGQLELEMPT